MTDTIKANTKTNEKPTDMVYAIARFPVGRDAEFFERFERIGDTGYPIITTDQNCAMTFQSRIEASMAIRDLDETWTIVRVG